MTTPLADFVSHLLSLNVPRDKLAETIALAEAAFGRTPRGGVSAEERREKERVRKAAWRANASRAVPGTVPPESIIESSKTLSSQKKKKSAVPPVPRDNGDNKPDDGWPADFLEQFWQAFPPYRRESKRKVGEKLERIRAEGKVAWGQIIGAARRYAATDPGQYACAPLVWLNGERWDREYGSEAKSNGGSHEANRNGHPATRNSGYATLAARLRRGGAGRQQRPPAGDEPEDGRRDTQQRLQLVDRSGEAAPAPTPPHR